MKMHPKLRFPGFTDEWKQYRIGDITQELKEYKTLASQYPLLTSSRDGLILQSDFRGNVSTNNPDALFSVVDLGVCTYRHMSDDDIFHFNINTICKGLVSKEYPVFNARNKNSLYLIVEYLNSSVRFRYFCKEQKMGGTRTRLYYNKLCEFKLILPGIEEQEKIAAFFKSIDNLIELHQHKLTHLQAKKKSLLQKMFPKKGERVPEVRFPGFEGDWEQRKLIKQIDKVLDYRGKSPTKFGAQWGESGYLVLSALNVKDGYIDKSIEAKYGNQELFNCWMGAERLEKDDVLFTTEAPLGNVAQIPDNDGYILNQRVVGFKVSHQVMDNNFLATLLRSPLFQRGLKSNSTGGTAQGIGMKEFAKFDVMIPINVVEQKKIGDFFKRLDNLITLHQRKLTHLQTQKKALLQQMLC